MCRWTGSSLLRVMAFRLFGGKPLPKQMPTYDGYEETTCNAIWTHTSYLMSSKYIWKCRQHNGGHFVPAWICYPPLKWSPVSVFVSCALSCRNINHFPWPPNTKHFHRVIKRSKGYFCEEVDFRSLNKLHGVWIYPKLKITLTFECLIQPIKNYDHDWIREGVWTRFGLWLVTYCVS